MQYGSQFVPCGVMLLLAAMCKANQSTQNSHTATHAIDPCQTRHPIGPNQSSILPFVSKEHSEKYINYIKTNCQSTNIGDELCASLHNTMESCRDHLEAKHNANPTKDVTNTPREILNVQVLLNCFNAGNRDASQLQF